MNKFIYVTNFVKWNCSLIHRINFCKKQISGPSFVQRTPWFGDAEGGLSSKEDLAEDEDEEIGSLSENELEPMKKQKYITVYIANVLYM